jgi:hypothetical protein
VPVCGICQGTGAGTGKRHLVSIRKLQSAMRADIVTVDFAERLASIYAIRKFEGKAWRATFTYEELDNAFQDKTLLAAFRDKAVPYEY